MQPLRISFRVSPFPTTFPSFFTLLLRLSLVVVITRPRCGRTLKPFRSDIFIFFFSFFPSTFFLFGSPGGSILLRFFFWSPDFSFFTKKVFHPLSIGDGFSPFESFFLLCVAWLSTGWKDSFFLGGFFVCLLCEFHPVSNCGLRSVVGGSLRGRPLNVDDLWLFSLFARTRTRK